MLTVGTVGGVDGGDCSQPMSCVMLFPWPPQTVTDSSLACWSGVSVAQF